MVVIFCPRLRGGLPKCCFVTDLRAARCSGGRACLGRTMSWVRFIGIGAAVTVLSGCGVLGGGSPPATVPPSPAAATGVPATTVPSPAARAVASPTAAPPPAAARPTATTEAPAAATNTVWVGNTDGEGVYVRKTPVMADRAKPYADGTALTIVGDDVDGDGQHWKHIKTPDGLEGYVPSIYTVATPP